MSVQIYALIAGVLVFLLTAGLTRRLIPVLRSMKMGQRILEIGPRWHKNKEGTPTMGGISFLLAGTVIPGCMLLFAMRSYPTRDLLGLLLTLLYACANGLVGITDDLTKLRKKQNAGLTPIQKLVLQVALAVAYLVLLRIYGLIDTDMNIPFTSFTVQLGWTYWFFAGVLLVWVVNCANLTDGIDGLCSSVTLIVGLFFTVASLRENLLGSAVSGAALCGASLGFLIYNLHPARVFMGDTGSLYLGALAAGSAFLYGSPLLILVVGIVYALEGVSVMLQVGFFKLTGGKRLFRMAPFHHHLEKCGWSEYRIVGAAVVLSVAAAGLSLVLL